MIDKDILLKEFEFENTRCQGYFDLMYRTLQFTFVAIVTLTVLALNPSTTISNAHIILSIILPLCIYVFGIMYTYNAYVLAICGERAEKIHQQIYKIDPTIIMSSEQRDFYNTIRKYIVSDRKITLISYGVPLGFFIVIPAASCWLANVLFKSNINALLSMCSIICLMIYYVLMLIIVLAIVKHFFITKIQN